jgi:DNA-binding GntR family transcriptional regulator
MGEHAAIVEAALERDADRAVDLLVAHIRGTAEWFVTGAAAAIAAES